MQSLRYIQIAMVASIALFFSLVAFNNLTAFQANWQFVQHVLSMDTTFQDGVLMKRAITNPLIQKAAYFLIILWQAITALICWLGCLILFRNIKEHPTQFHEAKKWAFIGLFFGFLLYMVGFIILGGEWFSMWQSKVWNGQAAAGLFLSLILFVMVFLK